ncbi:MAG: hypothetical protein QOH59_3175 [Gemmatimonadales bacterium]|jgi:hypothetical protein|nr:hypothetical protein [Gemmatimonadales bacterium]
MSDSTADRHQPVTLSAWLPPVILLAAIDLVLAATYYADYLLGQPLLPLTRQLDLGGESNLATWYASMKWGLASLVFFVPAWPRFQPKVPSTYPILLVPLLCLLFSIDEVAQLHERLGGQADALLPGGVRGGGIFQRTGVWMLLLIPPTCVAAIMGGRALAREYPGHQRILLRAGVAGLAFLLAAGGVELLANLVEPGSHLQVLQVLVEETGEMLAATAVYWVARDLQRVFA